MNKPLQASIDSLAEKMSDVAALSAPAKKQKAFEAFQVAVRENLPFLNTRISGPGGHTPLTLAVKLGSIPLAQGLLEAGANPNVTTVGGCAPLHLASRHDGPAMLRLLLKHGANVAQRDLQGNTSLHHTMLRPSELDDINAETLPVVETLISAGANKMECNGLRQYPFHVAATRGHSEAFKLLMPPVEQRKELFNEKVGAAGGSIIHLIRGTSDAGREILEEVLRWGADPLQTSWSGWTALHSQASAKTPPIIIEFVKLGVDVNAQDVGGRTALHLACESKCANAAMDLILAGADPEIADVTGTMPMTEIATLAGRADTDPYFETWSHVFDLARSCKAMHTINAVNQNSSSSIKPL